MCEQSVMSVNDERASLNDGFIALDDKDDVDMSCMMSEPDLSRCHGVEGEYVSLDGMVRQAISDTSVNLADKTSQNQSFSSDSFLDGSVKKSGLRRGAPNSLQAGLCRGSEREVQKLRRSFGLDKSDIGYPIPVSVPNVTGSDVKDLNQSITSYDSINVQCDTVSCSSTDVTGSIQCESADSVRQQDSVNIDTDKRDVTGMDTDFLPCNDNDKQSKTNETDISKPIELGVAKTLSSFAHSECNKVIPKPFEISHTLGNTCMKVVNVDHSGSTSEVKKTLVDQKCESVDSLFSEMSSSSPPPSSQREMTRSISADSGKGSICDESFGDPCNVTVTDEKDNTKVETNVLSETSKMSQDETLAGGNKNSQCNDNVGWKSADTVLASLKCESLTEAPTCEQKSNFPAQKSRSSHDLHDQEVIRTPGVSRSKSLLDNTVGRKNNGKPNLQISAETHKLLARAGYIRDEKTDEAKEPADFSFPGNMKFPLIIKQADAINPRRESLIALQKNKAGFVKNNVRQIEKISEETEDITEKYASPFRFPNSTTRKRGMSPMTIPIGLNPDDLGCTIQADDKLSFGTARLPISTQLIKPSDPSLHMNIDANVSVDKSGPLKRKPSIYYARKEVEDSVGQKFRSLLDSKVNGDNNSVINQSAESTDMEIDQNEQESTVGKSLFDGQNLDLNKSLEETINMVCTPMSEKLIQNQDRIHRNNKENSKTAKKMPDLKAPLTTPLAVDTITLRTGSGKTPVEVLKTSKSPCSPVKPLKRLGSPASPRCRVVRSPKMLKNRRHLLSAIPNEGDLNNLWNWSNMIRPQ